MKTNLQQFTVKAFLAMNVIAAGGHVTCSQSVFAADPQVQLLAKGSLPGLSKDLSGLTGQLETETDANQLGGFSAIEYSGQHDRYLVLSDRGPGDGAASFACRYHEFELTIDLNQRQINPSLVKTVMLQSAAKTPLSGSLAAVAQPAQADGLMALDAEGLRLTRAGGLLISDEYGPSVAVFGADGRRIRQFNIPEAFKLCKDPQATGARGTFPNRGLEGLAVTSDNGNVIAAMQGPLVQDGAVVGDKCLGLNTRWLQFEHGTQQTKQFVYQLTDESSGISEVLAIDEQQFLVLERDSKAGLEARIKRIYLADLSGASDVSNIDSLNRKELPDSVKPMKKTLLIDLLDERWGLAGAQAPEKPEGITWGPNLPDGRRLLIVCTDNDFENERTSDFYAFAVAL